MLEVGARAGTRLGVSFHVGSQQRDLLAWDTTLEVVSSIATRAADVGARVDFLNLGGGFPGTYTEATPPIEAYGVAVRAALARWFPDGLPELMIEPGRYVVADAGVLRTDVVLVSRRSPDDAERWVYLDCGKVPRARRDWCVHRARPRERDPMFSPVIAWLMGQARATTSERTLLGAPGPFCESCRGTKPSAIYDSDRPTTSLASHHHGVSSLQPPKCRCQRGTQIVMILTLLKCTPASER